MSDGENILDEFPMLVERLDLLEVAMAGLLDEHAEAMNVGEFHWSNNCRIRAVQTLKDINAIRSELCL